MIKGTRTPVRASVEHWKFGDSPEEMLHHLPHLRLAAAFDALSYAVFKALVELTGQVELGPAILMTLRDAIEYRLENIEVALRTYERRYGMVLPYRICATRENYSDVRLPFGCPFAPLRASAQGRQPESPAEAGRPLFSWLRLGRAME